MSTTPISEEFSELIDGVEYTARCAQAGRTITVHYRGKHKTTQLGNIPLGVLRRQLLVELVNETKSS